jgi:hypothetical protein
MCRRNLANLLFWKRWILGIRKHSRGHSEFNRVGYSSWSGKYNSKLSNIFIDKYVLVLDI